MHEIFQVTLCLEAVFCECFAISATRIYVQADRQLITDPCDNRIIRLNNFLQILACVCALLAIIEPSLQDAAECVKLIADIVYIITSGCMQAQTWLELSKHPTASDY